MPRQGPRFRRRQSQPFSAMPPAPPCSWPLLYHRLRTGPPCGLRDVPVRRRPPLPGAAQYRRKFACPCCSVDRPVAKEGSQRARESPHRMQTRTNELSGVSSLFPFPEGWYFVASRKAIEKKKLLRKTWLGEQIIVWCDRDGGVCVAEAYCPHLGADLGPEAGGRVRGGRLVCPFHGFEYDITGQCVATPYAPAPKSARLRLFETRQILGLVFAWHSTAGRAPQWDQNPPPPRASAMRRL
ncbi:MAG: Rieske 2Fe-2S domain-containing protein [Alphaproteobacteria bacterium]|nr:Rieske 2Fe-2S domain-containing protein [Alphaproteobacteria bacterium]